MGLVVLCFAWFMFWCSTPNTKFWHVVQALTEIQNPPPKRRKEDLVITTSIFLAVWKLHLIIFVYFWLLTFLVKLCNRTAHGVATHFLAPLDGTFTVVQKWGCVLNIGAEKENRTSRSFPKSWGELYALLWMQSDQLAGHIFPKLFQQLQEWVSEKMDWSSYMGIMSALNEWKVFQYLSALMRMMISSLKGGLGWHLNGEWVV